MTATLPAVVGLVAKWRGVAALRDRSFVVGDPIMAVAYRACADELEATLSALTAEAGKGEYQPIERDEAYDRDYIPMPGDWEVQTKGKGSTFRLCDKIGHRRLAIPDAPYLHETLTLMAREVNGAWLALSTATPAGEWREIESAPKDGTRVLLYTPYRCDNCPDSSGMCVAYWHDLIGDWCGGMLPSGRPVRFSHDNTHWRPLPAPPLAASPRGASAATPQEPCNGAL
jgi:hypothetical protein